MTIKKNTRNDTHARTRESKDITCAVRLNRSLYAALNDAAEIENSSLSDIIRQALTDKIEEIRRKNLSRRLEAQKLQTQLDALKEGADPEAMQRLQEIEQLVKEA
jgi:uncharacterized protein (DUF1778 family)